VWTNEADQALEELKTFLTKPPVMVPPAYVTPIRQGGSISRIGYVSDMDTHQIRDGYVSMEYWKKNK
jgi:hypothetical protein